MNTRKLPANVYSTISQLSKVDQIKREARKKTWSSLEGHGYLNWVQDNWTSRGKPLDFIKHKYLLDIYKDQHWFLAFMKSAQTGGTERVITESVWLADQFQENAVYVFPTGGSMSDMVRERVDEPINNKQYLRIASGREIGVKKGIDNVGLKRFSKGFLYFRGSNSPSQITSVPADMTIGDEVDRMPMQNIPYIPKRLEHSNRKWQRWLSTPTIPNFGIHKIFLETDQRYYNIKCTKCNEWQVLDFWRNIEYKKKNDIQVEWAKLVCSKCKQDIVPWECEGNWVATVPGADKHGYHITKLYSPMLDVKKTVETSLGTSEWELQQFYNQDLGLPYEPKGGRITEEMLEACKRDYRCGLKEGNNFMGVDVGRKLHVIIQNEDKVVYINSVDEFEELDKLMKEYDIKRAVLDALPETRKAQEFCNRFRGRAFISYYSGLSQPKEGEWFQIDGQVVNSDRTITLDMWTDRLKKQKVGLPKNIRDYVEFIEHMKVVTRIVTKNSKGEPKAQYIETGPDHFYHAGNYSNIARAMFEKVDIPEIFSV